MSVCKIAPVVVFQSLTVLSGDPDVTTSPLGEKATDSTLLVCPLSVCKTAPVVVFQSLTVSSNDPDAITSPLGEKATDQTRLVCPSSVCKTAPVVVSQSRIVLSLDADAITLPSGEKATDTTASLCPFSVCTRVALRGDLNADSTLCTIVPTVLSCDFDAGGILSGENLISGLAGELLELFGPGRSVDETSSVKNEFVNISDWAKDSVAPLAIDACSSDIEDWRLFDRRPP